MFPPSSAGILPAGLLILIYLTQVRFTGLHHTYTSLRQNPRMRFCRMRQPELQHRCCGLKVLHQQDFQTYTSLRQNPRMRFCRMRQPVLQHRCCGLTFLFLWNTARPLFPPAIRFQISGHQKCSTPISFMRPFTSLHEVIIVLPHPNRFSFRSSFCL